MPYYIITFNGIQPVGACALVKADSVEDSFERFLRSWREAYPSYDPEPVRSQPVDDNRLDVHGVEVILNGDY